MPLSELYLNGRLDSLSKQHAALRYNPLTPPKARENLPTQWNGKKDFSA
jgi:hypothetical protein